MPQNEYIERWTKQYVCYNQSFVRHLLLRAAFRLIQV